MLCRSTHAADPGSDGVEKGLAASLRHSVAQNGAPESAYGMQDWEARHDLPVAPRPVIVCNCKCYRHIPADWLLGQNVDCLVALHAYTDSRKMPDNTCHWGAKHGKHMHWLMHSRYRSSNMIMSHGL